MNIKAIIFDCDGTLVDSEQAHLNAWNKVASRYDYAFTDEEMISFIGRPDSVVAQLFSPKFNKTPPHLLLKQKCDFIVEDLKKGLPPIKGTVKFLEHLLEAKDSHGLKLAVASAALKHEVLLNLKGIGHENSFDLVLSGHDDLSEYQDAEGVNKPKPYIYTHAAKLLNVEPSQCVVIEDSWSGVTAGKQAGCITIAIPHSFSKYQDLSHAHINIQSLEGYDYRRFLELIEENR